ncbi:MAG: flavin reductase, partial [Pseudomonadota bacterium]
HQQAIGEAFVRSIDAFGRTAFRFNEAGVPILSGCLAVFECTQYACHDAGDHTIILGEVQTAHERPGDGLIFANGAFAKLPLSATAA